MHLGVSYKHRHFLNGVLVFVQTVVHDFECFRPVVVSVYHQQLTVCRNQVRDNLDWIVLCVLTELKPIRLTCSEIDGHCECLPG